MDLATVDVSPACRTSWFVTERRASSWLLLLFLAPTLALLKLLRQSILQLKHKFPLSKRKTEALRKFTGWRLFIFMFTVLCFLWLQHSRGPFPNSRLGLISYCPQDVPPSTELEGIIWWTVLKDWCKKKKIVAVSASKLLEEWKNTHLPRHSLCHNCQII